MDDHPIYEDLLEEIDRELFVGTLRVIAVGAVVFAAIWFYPLPIF